MKSALVVDDEEVLQEVYAKYLEHLGFDDIVVAKDALDGYVQAHKRKFDLIALDHKMPVLKGADFLKAMRNSEGVNQKTYVDHLRLSAGVLRRREDHREYVFPG